MLHLAFGGLASTSACIWAVMRFSVRLMRLLWMCFFPVQEAPSGSVFVLVSSLLGVDL